jgi:hypothetical protein
VSKVVQTNSSHLDIVDEFPEQCRHRVWTNWITVWLCKDQVMVDVGSPKNFLLCSLPQLLIIQDRQSARVEFDSSLLTSKGLWWPEDRALVSPSERRRQQRDSRHH